MSEGTAMGLGLASIFLWPSLGGLVAVPLALTAHRWGENVYLFHVALFFLIAIFGFSIFVGAGEGRDGPLELLVIWNIPSMIFLGIVGIKKIVGRGPMV